MTTSGLRPYLWMLAGSFAFSWMVILTNLASAGVPWQLIALVRSAVPLVAIALWCWRTGVPLVFPGPPALWLRSLAGSCSLVGTFFALTRLDPADVVTIQNVFPVWIALLSWPLLGVVPAPAVWLAIACGIVGVAVIQQPHMAEGNYLLFVMVAVSLSTAVAMMGLHQLRGIDPRAVVVHFSATSLLFAFVMLGVGIEPTREPFATIHAVQLLGVGAAAMVGQLFLTMAFTHGDPARVSVVSLSQVVFVVILAVVVLGKEPEADRLIGIPLVLGPTAWLLLRRRAGVKPKPILTE